jgi:SNF2 family DNA or RNA helicase
MKLSEISSGQFLMGVEPNNNVRVIAVDLLSDSTLAITFRRADNSLGERTIYAEDCGEITIVEDKLQWDFKGNPDAFKLAVEAYRINLAYLFDPMMAVHTSNVEPLPHQITAVYGSMLPKQPLRFVLADDPGAGKTIMAGLFIKELMIRGDADRVLIVTPGSLVNQWQDELMEKFGLEFEVLNKYDLENPVNTFERKQHVLCRLDQLSRNEELALKATQVEWDLVIFDEAHKLGAHYFGNDLKKTKRFELGEKLGASTRHFLLMTATPHNGKEEDFQQFLSLLDSDRFYGKQRDGSRHVATNDLMRRMVKEDLRRFDGTKLFPERCAQTVTYELSDTEQSLYDAVTHYVREEMNRAENLVEGKKNQVGFALTSLQRRLASSPAAIYKSLDNRLKRLQDKLEDVRSGRQISETPFETSDMDDLEDELPDEEYENLENTVVSSVTAAQTEHELLAEIEVVRSLKEQAYQVKLSGLDRKWERLSELLQDTPEMRDASGNMRKLIIFTEYKDTLEYLKERIQGVLGRSSAVVDIHGGTGRDQRAAIQEDFCNVSDVLVLVATDAASEGVNLQRATNLMINYDLPWNPNRLEQRFGRIHRIGQEQVCWLWNLVSSTTREGEVYKKLLDKLEVARVALGGRVFDILGELFEEKPLRDLLIEAVRYGEDASRIQLIESDLDKKLGQEAILEAITLKKEMLAEETLGIDEIYKVKEDMDRAEARRLQPYFIRSFFLEAARHLDLSVREKNGRLFELPYVSQRIQQRDRQISGRDKRYSFPVTRKYDRICFEQEKVHSGLKPTPVLMHPAHPLMQAMTDLVLEDTRNVLEHGAVLIDPQAVTGSKPYLLVLLEHSIREGTKESDHIISRQVQFVRVGLDGEATHAGWAPHLDLVPATSEQGSAAMKSIDDSQLISLLTKSAPQYATEILAKEHFALIKHQREAWVNQTLQAVHERLTGEIRYLQD